MTAAGGDGDHALGDRDEGSPKTEASTCGTAPDRVVYSNTFGAETADWLTGMAEANPSGTF